MRLHGVTNETNMAGPIKSFTPSVTTTSQLLQLCFEIDSQSSIHSNYLMSEMMILLIVTAELGCYYVWKKSCSGNLQVFDFKPCLGIVLQKDS